MIQPVMASYDEPLTQMRMDAFFSVSQRFAKIRSKRLQAAVAGVTGGKLAAELVIGHSEHVTDDTEPRADSSVDGNVGAHLMNTLD